MFSGKFKNQKEIYILILLISSVSLIIFRQYIFGSRYYIFNDAGADTMNSYVPNLIYFSNNLRSWNFWSFEMGLGTNIYSAGSLLTDPFNLILFLLGSDLIPKALVFIAMLKLILAGVFFYLFLSNHPLNNATKLIFSLLYALNGYILLWGQHYHFATVAVLFPLILHYFEKWIIQKKWKGLVLSICITGIFSYFFLFTITIFLIIYAIIRYFIENKMDYKLFFLFGLKTSLLYILALGLASCIFIPSVVVVLESPRLSGIPLESMLHTNSLQYYIVLFTRFFSSGIPIIGHFNASDWWNYYEYPIVYCGLFTLVCIPQFIFGSNSYKKFGYVSMLLVTIILLMFPIFSFVFNGFSAIYYRWSFIVIPIFLLVAAFGYNEKGTRNKIYIIFSTVVIYTLSLLLVLLLSKNKFSLDPQMFTNVIRVFMAITVFLCIYAGIQFIQYKNPQYSKWTNMFLVFIICVEIIYMSNPILNDRSTLMKDNQLVYNDASLEIIDNLSSKDPDFYRIIKRNLALGYTDPLFQNYKGTTSFNSLNQPNYLEFLSFFGVEPPYKENPNIIGVPADNYIIQSFLGGKYLISNEKITQEGYQFVSMKNNYYVYENLNALPLGIIYDKFITNVDLNQLSPTEKEISLFKAIILDSSQNPKSGITKLSLNEIQIDKNDELFPIEEIQLVNMAPIGDLIPEQIEVKSLNDDPQIIFDLNTLAVGKIVLSFIYESDNENAGQIFWADDSKGFNEGMSTFFSIKKGKHRYDIPLGEISANHIRLDFSEANQNYKISKIKIYSVSKSVESQLEMIKNDIKEKQEGFKVEHYNNDIINGYVDLRDPKWLSFSIPYDKGWSIIVNGNKEKLIKVNNGLSGVYLKAGKNNIELKYEVRGQAIGLRITILSAIIMLLLELYVYRKNKKLYKAIVHLKN